MVKVETFVRPIDIQPLELGGCVTPDTLSACVGSTFHPSSHLVCLFHDNCERSTASVSYPPLVFPSYASHIARKASPSLCGSLVFSPSLPAHAQKRTLLLLFSAESFAWIGLVCVYLARCQSSSIFPISDKAVDTIFTLMFHHPFIVLRRWRTSIESLILNKKRLIFDNCLLSPDGLNHYQGCRLRSLNMEGPDQPHERPSLDDQP